MADLDSTRLRAAVVVPVRGHSALLQGCLTALRDQRRPLDEVIVVDDSTDGSLGDLPGVTVLRSGGRGPYVARNLGWRSSSADVVLFCDARSRPRPRWSQVLVEQFADPEVVLAGSEVLVVEGASAASAAAAALQTFRLENYVGEPFFRPYLPTCNLTVRRSVLETIDGFPPVRSGGDADLCWRALDVGGGRIAAVAEVLMDWVPRDRGRDLLEQHYRYGRSNHQLRSRWESAGAPVPVPRPLPRIAVRAVVAAMRLAIALVRRDRRSTTQALLKASWAATEVGYALERAGAQRAARAGASASAAR